MLMQYENDWRSKFETMRIITKRFGMTDNGVLIGLPVIKCDWNIPKLIRDIIEHFYELDFKVTLDDRPLGKDVMKELHKIFQEQYEAG